MHIPQLIIDLAIMLSTAAVVAIIFKKFKIPTILGYILAGFLTGPYFPYFLEVESISSVEIWKEIGVVIILFHIGLEFNFQKLVRIGSTAFVSALVKMSGVMLVGYGFGMLIGMSTTNSIFLGAMLSISSTVVIQKCLEELDLAKEKFSELVLGSLVVEDVLAIFIMVVLSTMAVSQNSGASAVVLHIFMMLCYLVIWLVLGIYFVPTWLDKAMKHMSDEVLTILSIGFCFMMALLANKLGFSMELGAFLAGSFFAGTRHVHDIERVTSGVKDIFGAVFFLSVGMEVDPQIIVTKWTIIVPIAIIAIVAKLIFATCGMVLSGQNLDTSVRGGVALAPIGEFSFIIASLGISLGVMDETLYPIIVAASILTIILTPGLIKKSDKTVSHINKILPEKLKKIIESYTSNDKDTEEVEAWNAFLKEYFLSLVIYGPIMLVVSIAGSRWIEPLLANVIPSTLSKIIVLIGIYLILALFARPYMGSRSISFTHLWMSKFYNRPPLFVMVLIKIAVFVFFGYIPLKVLLDLHYDFVIAIILIALIVFCKLDFVSTYYLKLEARFLANLNQRTIKENGMNNEHWLEEDYSIFSWFVPKGASYAEKSINDLAWGRNFSVYVVKIRHNNKNIAMPPASTVIHEGDKVYVMGDEESLRLFHSGLDIGPLENLRTLKDFLDNGYPDANHALSCLVLKVKGTENYVGKPLKHSGINARANCIVLGIEREAYTTKMPDANMQILEGDILWIVGTDENLKRLAAHSTLEEQTEE